MSAMKGKLPDSVKRSIAEQTVKDGFGSESDVLMLVKEAQVREAQLLLESKLLEGLRAPVSPMTPTDWDELKDQVLRRTPEAQE